MLESSFILLDKIGLRKEKTLRSEVRDWDGFLEMHQVKGIGWRRKKMHDARLRWAKEALVNDDLAFFKTYLPPQEHYRLYHAYKHDTIFMDLETDGSGRITVLGLCSNKPDRSGNSAMMTFVRGMNLDSKTVRDELKKHKLLVTYNGSSFDIPRLKKDLGVDINKIGLVHVDLRGVCSRLSLRGGLKKIEEELAIYRPKHLRALGGDHPINLWTAFHASGDREYLDLLVRYNEEDTMNLYFLAEKVVHELWQST